MAEGTSPEAKVRIKALLAKTGPPYDTLPNQQVRKLRAIQVLEMIGSEEAESLLKHLATGSPYALQTREANAALEWLDARQKSE